MKSVGLCTYYGDNYGGCLQAYALQTSIEKLGFDCHIIKYEWRTNKNVLTQYISKIMTMGNILEYYKKRCVMRENQKNFLVRLGHFQIFRDKYLKVDKNNCVNIKDYYTNPPEYDSYVCGSDQIWNPNFYGCCNQIYFLDFVLKGKKRIAYAPSIGVSSIADKYKEEMKALLQKMDYISVRELEGAKIIKELIDQEVPTVLDPTLLLTATEWLTLENKVCINEPYIFCYLFSDLKYIDKVKKHFKDKMGLKIVSLPFSTREMDSDDEKIFEAGPAEFVHLIKNAALVITDSFHATAFSINMKVPFYSLLRAENANPKNMNSRLYSILKLCRLEDRIITPDGKVPDTETLNVDFCPAEQYLNKKRDIDIKYLKRALGV